MTKTIKQTKCTCEHPKRNAPHEYTCAMNINQHDKPKQTPKNEAEWITKAKEHNREMFKKEGLFNNKINQELLEACKYALKWLDFDNRKHAENLIKQAIAKAEGRAE